MTPHENAEAASKRAAVPISPETWEKLRIIAAHKKTNATQLMASVLTEYATKEGARYVQPEK